jgi:hypothetical protein
MFPFWIDFSVTAMAQAMSVLAIASIWITALLTCRPYGG